MLTAFKLLPKCIRNETTSLSCFLKVIFNVMDHKNGSYGWKYTRGWKTEANFWHCIILFLHRSGYNGKQTVKNWNWKMNKAEVNTVLDLQGLNI